MRIKLGLLALLAAVGCTHASTTTSSAVVARPNVTGTVFTIVFENDDRQAVIMPTMPFFYRFANENGQALAYTSSTHPSLPNYIQMVSGASQGIVNDNDPKFAPRVLGHDNIADQLEAASVPWRAYMESMGEPCKLDSTASYSAHHAPFLYFDSVVSNRARCEEHVVDMDKNLDADLASDAYRYMFIVPNMCNNIHSCAPQIGDAWLEKIVAKIMASPGYKNGGALFVLFDEGSNRVFGASATLATIVASPNLVTPGFATGTPFTHASYLATVEDIFGLPRLPTTRGAVSMGEFFSAPK